MNPWWLVVALGVAACSGPVSERDIYLASVQTSDLHQADRLCQQIHSAALQSECRTHNAARAAALGKEALASQLCEALPDPVWLEECWFLITDELALSGSKAIASCKKSGRFRHNCIGHAIGRDVRSTEGQYHQVGAELALYRAILSIVERYKPGAPSPQREVTARTLTARIIASRWNDGPFDADLCGKSGDELCIQAYAITLDATPPEIAIEGLCDTPPTRADVERIGARGWTDPSQPLAQRAWSKLCDDLQSGAIVRDGSLGMGAAPRTPPPRPGILPGERMSPHSKTSP